MTVPFDTCGFFAGDSLLHAEVPGHPYGYAATSDPYRLRQDGWSGLLLLLCLLLAASLVRRFRRRLGEVSRGVFLPVAGKKDEPVADDPLRYSTRLIAIGLLSLSAAMISFACTQHGAGFYLFPETPYLLFAAFLLLWLAYFLVKRLMSGFVNWVFFRSEKNFTWQRVGTFLFAAEAMFFFVLALVAVYLPVPPGRMLLMVLFLVLLFKILLLFRTYAIFFSNLYGTLHLIVYFCTLELMPLLVAEHVLTYADSLLTMRIW